MGEDFEQAALREIREECGNELKVTNLRFLTAINTKYYDEGRHFIVIVMVADHVSGEAIVMEPEKCETWDWFIWSELPLTLMQGITYLQSQYPFLYEI